MATAEDLKQAVLEELYDQVTNGSAQHDKDTGEIERVSTPANVLTAALNYLKQYPPEQATEDDTKTSEIGRTLERFTGKTSGPFQGHA